MIYFEFYSKLLIFLYINIVQSYDYSSVLYKMIHTLKSCLTKSVTHLWKFQSNKRIINMDFEFGISFTVNSSAV